MNKIALIGPLPAPIGGVSIHIQRLNILLEREGFEIALIDEAPITKKDTFNFRSLNFYNYFRIIYSSDIIHVHSSLTIFRIFHILSCFLLRKNVIVTLHSWRIKSVFLKKIQKFLFSKADVLICVNNIISESIDLKNTVVRPAFIQPCMAYEKDLDIDIVNWINLKKQNGMMVISSNAYRLQLHNSVDLYGLDMAINMVDFLVFEKKQNVALIFVVSTVHGNDQMFSDYIEQIKRMNLTENINLIQKGELSFVKLIELSDFTCRLTNTDGDALSIRESLYLGKPVVASDIVERPEGAIIFRTRDQMDLNNTMLDLIQDKTKQNVYLKHEYDAVEFYSTLYNEKHKVIK